MTENDDRTQIVQDTIALLENHDEEPAMMIYPEDGTYEQMKDYLETQKPSSTVVEPGIQIPNSAVTFRGIQVAYDMRGEGPRAVIEKVVPIRDD
jgi:hypothetical protein